MSPKLDSVIDIDNTVIDVSTLLLNILITNLIIQNCMSFLVIMT